MNRLGRFLSASVATAAALFLLSIPPAGAQVPATDVHLGVATCAGGPCHGKAQNTKVNGVMQDEYLIWQKSDKHAKAFTALQGELGQRIAHNLGLPSAEKAEVCLNCHSDNVPAEERGVQFNLSDGVGCEACHGGSQRWLGAHISGKVPHNQLVSEDGLYATDRPLERAKLCVNCHFGDENRFVTHKIMGAGHPRMPFELETFTQIEPAHFVVDDVYRKRKAVAKGVQFWAVGQAVALERITSELQNPKYKGDGVFPELVFFDCDACHHPTSSLRWEKRNSADLGPGLPHLNDANAIMLKAIASRVAPNDGEALAKAMPALHAAVSTGVGNPHQLAAEVAGIAHRLADTFAAHDFTKDDMRAMLKALVDQGRAGDVSDYAAAEQTTMAFASIIHTLKSEGDIDDQQYAGLKAALEGCYAATQKEEAYDPAKFVAASTAVARAMP